MKRIIFHIDVNNAFLSWTAVEMLKQGHKIDIRLIPSVVGGDEKKRHGVVLAKSFPAKAAGIVTGEPLYQARRKVDKLLVVPGARDKYEKYSNDFYKILCKYTPAIERYSIDECFMDMSGMSLMYDDPIKLAHQIKDEIYNELGFTVNVGIGNSKLCAKMASDFQKPNRVHTLFEEEIKEKMWPLKVDELFMVGKSAATKLNEMGITTIGNLANTDVNFLIKHFKAQGKMMYEYANGIDNSLVEKPIPKNQGIGHSTTLPYDINDIPSIKKILRKLSEMVGIRLRNENKYATVVSVQLKNSEFLTYGHQKKVINPICSDEDIFEVASELLKNMYKGDSIRLVGLRVSDFTDKTYEQISLFETAGKQEKREKVQKTLDEINKKYGKNIIKSAALYQNDD